MTTIIRVKYVECLPNSDGTEHSEITSVEREMLVNVNCPIRMVLEYIRKVACIDSTREFDLCDEVNCHLKNVSLYEPYTRGTDILPYLSGDENGHMTNLIPLLIGKAAKKCCDIMSKMRKPLRRTSSIKSTLKKYNIN